jgi:hypothetical protein
MTDAQVVEQMAEAVARDVMELLTDLPVGTRFLRAYHAEEGVWTVIWNSNNVRQDIKAVNARGVRALFEPWEFVYRLDTTEE